MPSTPTKLQDHLEVGCPVSVDLLSCDIMAQRCERPILSISWASHCTRRCFSPSDHSRLRQLAEGISSPALSARTGPARSNIQSTLMPTA
jgi:hypothetical protein